MRLLHTACVVTLLAGCASQPASTPTAVTIPAADAAKMAVPSAGIGGKLYVDVAATLDTKIAALRAYRSQIRSYPHPVSEDAVRRLAAMRGLECGMDCAERFQLLQMIRT